MLVERSSDRRQSSGEEDAQDESDKKQRGGAQTRGIAGLRGRFVYGGWGALDNIGTGDNFAGDDAPDAERGSLGRQGSGDSNAQIGIGAEEGGG